MIVYLSGNNGSGKTTLGRAMAKQLGWQHLPEEKFDVTYLDDLFQRQKRWSFEAQTHFLLFKVQLVQRAVADGLNAFIDRSPYEDAQIFARYFYERGKMDRRSYRTYQDLYRLIVPTLPQPDAFIYCDCSPAILRGRVAGRGRQYEENYPKGHLRLLNRYYRQWVDSACVQFPGRALMTDSGGIDFRTDQLAVQQIADELLFWLRDRDAVAQPSLFNADQKTPELLRPAKLASAKTVTRSNKLTAYIAAPFTGRATGPGPAQESSVPQQVLDYTPEAAHGRISDEKYRDFLLEIERIAQQGGFNTILPHRDVNAWGDRLLQPGEAMMNCTRGVLSSDVVIALTEKSFGVHYEVGIAVGYGIPVLQLQQYGGEQTFVGEGFKDVTGIQVIQFSSTDDLRPRLSAALTALASRAGY